MVLMASRSWQATTLLLVMTPGILGCAATSQVDATRVSATHLVASQWPTWAGGEPTDTPAPPTNSQYPNVLETPPSRPLPMLSADQQTSAAADLNTLRSRVSDQVKAAAAFDEKNTATALSEVTKGKLAADTSVAPN
jgi:hypothetical protein